MWPFSQWTTAGRAAVIYISMGALTVVWTGVWYFYLYNNPPVQAAYYWCTGFMVTGLTMILIGLVLARISRSTQPVVVAPPPAVPVTVLNLQPAAPAAVPTPINVTRPVVALQPTATVPALARAPLNLASPVAVPNGEIVLAPAQEPFAGLGGRNRK